MLVLAFLFCPVLFSSFFCLSLLLRFISSWYFFFLFCCHSHLSCVSSLIHSSLLQGQWEASAIPRGGPPGWGRGQCGGILQQGREGTGLAGEEGPAADVWVWGGYISGCENIRMIYQFGSGGTFCVCVCEVSIRGRYKKILEKKSTELRVWDICKYEVYGCVWKMNNINSDILYRQSSLPHYHLWGLINPFILPGEDAWRWQSQNPNGFRTSPWSQRPAAASPSFHTLILPVLYFYTSPFHSLLKLDLSSPACLSPVHILRAINLSCVTSSSMTTYFLPVLFLLLPLLYHLLFLS